MGGKEFIDGNMLGEKVKMPGKRESEKEIKGGRKGKRRKEKEKIQKEKF